jgi:hypothetical protein
MRTRVSVLFAFLCCFFLSGMTTPSEAASGGNGSWGCFFCQGQPSAIEPLVTYRCENVMDGDWGDGIKCTPTTFGCDMRGGACLYVVVNVNGNPTRSAAPAKALGRQPVSTAKPVYLF